MSCLTAHVKKLNLAFTVNSVEPLQNVQNEGADPVCDLRCRSRRRGNRFRHLLVKRYPCCCFEKDVRVRRLRQGNLPVILSHL